LAVKAKKQTDCRNTWFLYCYGRHWNWFCK